MESDFDLQQSVSYSSRVFVRDSVESDDKPIDYKVGNDTPPINHKNSTRVLQIKEDYIFKRSFRSQHIYYHIYEDHQFGLIITMGRNGVNRYILGLRGDDGKIIRLHDNEGNESIHLKQLLSSIKCFDIGKIMNINDVIGFWLIHPKPEDKIFLPVGNPVIKEVEFEVSDRKDVVYNEYHYDNEVVLLGYVINNTINIIGYCLSHSDRVYLDIVANNHSPFPETEGLCVYLKYKGYKVVSDIE